MKLFDLKREHKEALDAAEVIVTRAEVAARDLTAEESGLYGGHMQRAATLAQQIERIESQNTLTSTIKRLGGPAALLGGGQPADTRQTQRPMSGGYTESFLAFLRSGGKQATSALSEGFDPLFGGFALPALPRMSSAMYEGSDGAGGYTVSVPTDNLIVPLAVPDIGVRSISRVIPTTNDIKIPAQSAFGTAGIKTESGASSNTFAESDPTLSQFTLTAYMVGLTHTVSWELLQDVKLFQEFAVGDLLSAIDIQEDSFFVNGNGTSQPQGVVGNTGNGTGAAYAVESTGAYLLQATMDVLGTLKNPYFANAGWLMSRGTATAIRKAQQQANLFVPAWTRENGRDLLYGFPVTYSAAMPALPTATTAGVVPILFGSFADGYLIGDRGGSGTFIKVLDQPLATAGQTILLGYKRVDGRVRRSEAIQAITISHS